MASELPLNLFDCEFSDDIEWIYEADWHEENIRHLQQMWAQHAVRTAMLKRMLEAMDTAKVETDSDIAPWVDLSPPLYSQSDWIVPGKVKVYKPLLDRQKCGLLLKILNQYRVDPQRPGMEEQLVQVDPHNSHISPVKGFNRHKHKSMRGEVVDIMRVNVDKVLERDTKISELDDRAEALQQGASQFEASAGKLKRKFWWKNCKMWAILIAVILVIIIIIVVWVATTYG
ncbi:vesicle-associated membrane protein 3 [Mytilus galloprovincialis]|uniref:Vesicle-associated membrane protein 3 n=1 Tax=Mytilus galloprovincialis TaxID=29158 RepID=A0A8B6GGQ5_MYTGA|nr:vesicle-associated membrane protein 3 [Mytilus galloprovincialis]